MFWSAECSHLRAERFFFSLDVLYGGLGIGKLQVATFDKNIKFFFSCKFFPIFGHWIGSGSRSVFSLKCWIRIRIQIKWIGGYKPPQNTERSRSTAWEATVWQTTWTEYRRTWKEWTRVRPSKLHTEHRERSRWTTRPGVRADGSRADESVTSRRGPTGAMGDYTPQGADHLPPSSTCSEDR